MIAVQFPLPPSANKLWRNRKSRGAPFLSPAYQAWKQEAGWLIKASKVERIAGEFDIRIFVPKAMPGDADNRVKAILDLCKQHLTDDDKLAQDVRVTRSAEVPAGVCVVQITNSTTDLNRPSAGSGAAGGGPIGLASLSAA